MQMIAKTVARLANFDQPLGISALAASRPRRLVLCGLALLLTVMCLVTPPFQSPDEHRHFFRAYQLSEGVLLPYRLQTNVQEGTTVQALHTAVGGTLPRSVDVLLLATHADRLRFNPNERLRAADLVSALAIKVDVNDRVFFRFPHEIPFPPYAFVPQVAGILLARAFTDRILIQFYASRLVNAMFALTFVWLALLMVPSLWPICLAFCSLPLVSFQMGSSSPDAIVLGASILFGASLHVRGATWTRWMQGASLSLLTIKPFYAPVALLALSVSDSKFTSRLGLVVVSLLPAALWLALVSGLIAAVRTDVDFDASRQLAGVLHDPINYLRLAAKDLVVNGTWYAESMIGVLGWMDRPLPAPQLLFAYTLVLISPALCDSERSPFFNWWVLILACVLSTAAIQLALYLSFSTVGTRAIYGVQGRYFLPLFILVLFAARGLLIVRHTWMLGGFVIAIVVSALLTMHFIINSYYN
jgi:Predicted membrane protein (DUF2142)